MTQTNDEEVKGPNIEWMDKFLLENLREYEDLSDEDINGLEIIDNTEAYCTGCLEEAKVVEAAIDNLCDDCEFERLIARGDYIYDCMKEGDYLD